MRLTKAILAASAFVVLISVDLVRASDPIDPADLAFREQFGMDASVAHVVAAESQPIDERFGVHLFASESEELDRRAARQPEIASLRQALEKGVPGFAGLFTDHRAGGVVTLLVAGPRADLDAALAEANPSFPVVVKETGVSLSELQAVRDAVSEALDPLRSKGYGIYTLGVDIPENVVELGVERVDEGLRRELARFDSSGLLKVVEVEEPIPAACVSRSNCGSPLKGGLAITSVQGTCTSGLLMSAGVGGNSFLMTAGHCSNNPRYNTTWKHNNSNIGTVTLNSWYNLSRADAAAIDILNSSESNKIYINSTTAKSITSRQGQNGDSINDLVCHSGIVSGVQCGILEAEQTIYVEGVRFDAMRRAQMPVTYGDSGSPVWVQSTNIGAGIVSSFDANGNACYSHVFWVENELSLTTCQNATCT